MNKKKLNLFLIPLAIVLWIIILGRIVSYTKPEQLTDSIRLPISENHEVTNAIDTPGLLLDYPDPFTYRNSLVAFSGNERKQKDISASFINKPVEEPVLPAIAFNGMIGSSGNGKTKGFLIIDGKSVLVSENDTVSGLKVVKYWQDSVVLNIQNKTFTVKRK